MVCPMVAILPITLIQQTFIDGLCYNWCWDTSCCVTKIFLSSRFKSARLELILISRNLPPSAYPIPYPQKTRK